MTNTSDTSPEAVERFLQSLERAGHSPRIGVIPALRALSAALEAEKRQKLAIAGDKIDAVSELRQVKADRDALKAELAEAVVARDHAIDTLNAWFDRRKLAHNAIDETVLNAARGYLRTSRSGGMDQETSDVIEGVIEDMARLSVFADLFARADLCDPVQDERVRALVGVVRTQSALLADGCVGERGKVVAARLDAALRALEQGEG